VLWLVVPKQHLGAWYRVGLDPQGLLYWPQPKCPSKHTRGRGTAWGLLLAGHPRVLETQNLLGQPKLKEIKSWSPQDSHQSLTGRGDGGTTKQSHRWTLTLLLAPRHTLRLQDGAQIHAECKRPQTWEPVHLGAECWQAYTVSPRPTKGLCPHCPSSVPTNTYTGTVGIGHLSFHRGLPGYGTGVYIIQLSLLWKHLSGVVFKGHACPDNPGGWSPCPFSALGHGAGCVYG
jgi:hypothetical protein